ncbi:hypothetical protein [Chromobacterium violaceum]|uniref:hypothetical protein n=1 Tax=Chromobacterium violaceum TaxID=536 RepID=UPI001592ECBD|nr:hypothetical protein [Chromobacterium violaceum]MBX9267238.1 hypothetical protein [Chromobacterium violaceum]
MDDGLFLYLALADVPCDAGHLPGACMVDRPESWLPWRVEHCHVGAGTEPAGLVGVRDGALACNSKIVPIYAAEIEKGME